MKKLRIYITLITMLLCIEALMAQTQRRQFLTAVEGLERNVTRFANRITERGHLDGQRGIDEARLLTAVAELRSQVKSFSGIVQKERETKIRAAFKKVERQAKEVEKALDTARVSNDLRRDWRGIKMTITRLERDLRFHAYGPGYFGNSGSLDREYEYGYPKP